jgi:acetoin utilization protein AcuB
MLARELINDSIPPVKTSDTASAVLDWMGEFKVTHLPIVNHQSLLGIVSENDLLELQDEDAPVGNMDLLIPADTFALENSHIFDVLRLMALHRLDIVPVVDEKENYAGLITRADLIAALANMLGAKEPGGIIVLELQANNYALAEIGRICESNDAKVLSLTTAQSLDGSHLLVTLKLNIREMSRLINTFERFNYKIATVVFDGDQLDDVRSNYENLLRYLNI